MAKKKRMTAEERAAWEAEREHTVRVLRELVDRGWAELERKGVAQRPRPS